jgi:hypothetical protein
VVDGSHKQLQRGKGQLLSCFACVARAAQLVLHNAALIPYHRQGSATAACLAMREVTVSSVPAALRAAGISCSTAAAAAAAVPLMCWVCACSGAAGD